MSDRQRLALALLRQGDLDGSTIAQCLRLLDQPLGDDKSRIEEARAAGVKSVPALVLDGAAYHINFGAALSDLG
ncbi:hypothetical protein [Sorangium sp. So ce1024]|uniref:hypothetical protein n=1 Tax=Sorangium sp. So ce1024 TaxID=3133327 RepID=UPI003F09CFC7